ncbi:MAG: ATP-dependent helicase HrpB, partial [Paramuribaculum sp.]|nr:ATP-dependent helicase HrpB [Paramuribaculum sp.]
QHRGRKQPGRFARIISITAQYRRLVDAPDDNGPVDPADTGMLIASAYPERIALVADENGATVRYRLASGDFTTLDSADDLSKHRLLAIASLGNRVFLASPVDVEDIASQAQWVDNVSWDTRAGRAV